MGDFNIDISDMENPNAVQLTENLLHLGLFQMITSPTRHSKNNFSTMIDHIYTDSKCIKEAGNVTLNVSDHDLIYIIRKKEKVVQTKATFIGLSYRNYDREIFQDILTNSDWNDFYNVEGVDQAWSYFQGIIQNEIDLMCPLKNIRIKKTLG